MQKISPSYLEGKPMVPHKETWFNFRAKLFQDCMLKSLTKEERFLLSSFPFPLFS